MGRDSHLTTWGQNLGISVLPTKPFNQSLYFPCLLGDLSLKQLGFSRSPEVGFCGSLLQVYVPAFPRLLSQLQSTCQLSVFVDINCALSSALQVSLAMWVRATFLSCLYVSEVSAGGGEE